MGRYIYADEVGSEKGDSYVHKFWFAVQDSDVSDYLEAYEPYYLLADLSVEHEGGIRKKVAKLKKEFQEEYGTTYEEFMAALKPTNQLIIPGKKLASRIDLGENLLKTIANMKAAGISEQRLTIEV